MHARVSGELSEDVGAYPAGTPYRADDPELLLWVLFTLFDSAAVVYRAYVGSIARADEARPVDDYRVVGGLFGLQPGQMPETLAEVDSYRRRDARGRPAARQRVGSRAGREIVFEPPAPLLARPLVEAANLITIALLPERIRREYRFASVPPQPVRGLLVAGGAEYVKRAVLPLLPGPAAVLTRWRAPRRLIYTSSDVTVASTRVLWSSPMAADTDDENSGRAADAQRRAGAEAVQGDEDRPRGAPRRQPLRRSALDDRVRPRERWSHGGSARRRNGARRSSRRRGSRRCRCGRRSPRATASELGDDRLAIVFTDLVGFSDWALEAGDDISLELLREVAEAIEPPVVDHGGEVVKRLGDGMMAVFGDADAAAAAVFEARERLRSRRGRRVRSAYARWHARRLPAPARRRLPRASTSTSPPGSPRAPPATSSSSPARRSRSSTATRSARARSSCSAPRASRATSPPTR